MEINIDPQPLFDGIMMGLELGLSIVWTIIDTIIFIELNNPAGEVALFVALISAIFGAFKFLPRSIERYMYNQRY